ISRTDAYVERVSDLRSRPTHYLAARGISRSGPGCLPDEPRTARATALERACARLYTEPRAQRHGLRPRPTGGPARLPERRAHPARRLRRPPRADAGRPEHRRRDP